MTAGSTLRDLVWLSKVCILALLVLNLPQVIDPFVRHDDFPGLLGFHEYAYGKALDEGRWLNYWWHLRPVFWPAPVNFFLYLCAWGIFSAATSLAVLDRSAETWHKVYFALFLASSVPAFLISNWFNTLLPGLWVVTLYALSVLFLPHRFALVLLVPAVSLSFMAYTTYPFTLLTLILLSQKAPKSIHGLSVSLGMFFVSVTLALLLIFTLNSYYHGVFGIPVAEWREPTPVRSTADLMVNLEKVKIYLMDGPKFFGGGSPYFGVIQLVSFVTAWIILLRYQSYLAFLVFVAVMGGLGPLLLNFLLSGVVVPSRALGWLWILVGFTYTSASIPLMQFGGLVARVVRVALLCILLIQATLIVRSTYFEFPTWQRVTRDIANSVPENTEVIYIYGNYMDLEGADGDVRIQSEKGLTWRLTYLTGANVFLCDENPSSCQGVSPPFDSTATPKPDAVVVEPVGSRVFVRIPPRE